MEKAISSIEPANHIAVFQEATIRRVWHNEEWWFAIVDVVGILTDSLQPEGYVKDLRRRDPELAKGWGQIATPLRIETAGGAQRVNCANTEGLFRIIQSIPSPKAELELTLLHGHLIVVKQGVQDAPSQSAISSAISPADD